jgi:hypothetical protein
LNQQQERRKTVGGEVVHRVYEAGRFIEGGILIAEELVFT